MPIEILGPAIPSIDAPQGASLKCTVTFKNTGYVTSKFQASFWVGSSGWGLPISDPVVTSGLAPGSSVTKDVYGSVSPTAPLGSLAVRLEINNVLTDGTPGMTVYDSSVGTINVVTGVAAQITTVTLTKV